MLIKTIRLQNLLSFGPDTPELEMMPLNVLIGPNGSGKSNLNRGYWPASGGTARYHCPDPRGGMDRRLDLAR